MIQYLVVMNRYLITYYDGKYKHRITISAPCMRKAYDEYHSDRELASFELLSIVKL